MYRKNKQLRFDYIQEMMEIKEIREMIIEEYIEENFELSLNIIEYYGLDRIKVKYIDKYRNFDENYYSRNELKREERVFQIKMLIIREFQNNAKDYLHYRNRLFSAMKNDLEFQANENIDFIKKYYLSQKK
ncbi:hypothetical protein RZE82_02975 [Mollicutes bacterium LVI A0039]|nr:hypothetical protein RZE82_02975 [Mollicutes bacterium LVI A0039]